MPQRSSKPVRAPTRVVNALQLACEAYPNQRVTQIIVNALGADPFYVEDLEAAAALNAYARGEGSDRAGS